MTDRFNTIAGWALFAGVIALGLSILSGMYFQADKPHAPEKAGYEVADASPAGGAEEGPSLAELLASGDAAAGEAVFAKCQSCHTINQGGANGIGPNIWAIVGKPVGKHIAGFAYSSALSEHGGVWDYENLDHWLKSPKAFAAGTKMSFAGLSSGQDRANLILYMVANGGGPPLPTPEAPAADAAEAEAAGDPSAEAGPADAAGADAAGAVAQEAPADGAAAAN